MGSFFRARFLIFFGDYFISSPIEQDRLSISEEADLWGMAYAAPTEKPRVLKPKPKEKPEKNVPLKADISE